MNTLTVLAFVLLSVYASAADQCSPNSCQNGGTCSTVGSSIECACAPGFAGASCEKSTCSKAPNCQSCPGDELPCKKCWDFYGLHSEAPYCRACRDYSGCWKCDDTSRCTQCNNTALGPDLNGVATCSPCGKNCLSCDVNGGGKCDKCKEASATDPTSTSPVNGLCECAAYCTDCTTSGWSLCDQGKCEPGYGIAAGSICGKCPNNCDLCASSSRCTKCSTGYKLVGISCKSISEL